MSASRSHLFSKWGNQGRKGPGGRDDAFGSYILASFFLVDVGNKMTCEQAKVGTNHMQKRKTSSLTVVEWDETAWLELPGYRHRWVVGGDMELV